MSRKHQLKKNLSILSDVQHIDLCSFNFPQNCLITVTSLPVHYCLLDSSTYFSAFKLHGLYLALVCVSFITSCFLLVVVCCVIMRSLLIVARVRPIMSFNLFLFQLNNSCLLIISTYPILSSMQILLVSEILFYVSVQIFCASFLNI